MVFSAFSNGSKHFGKIILASFCALLTWPVMAGNVSNDLADSLLSQADSLGNIQQHAPAGDLYEQAALIYQSNRDLEGYWRTRYRQGQNLIVWGKLKEGISLLSETAKGIQPGDSIATMAWILLNWGISRVYFIQEDYENLLRVSEKTLDVFNRSGLAVFREIGYLIGSIGLTHYNSGDYERSLEYFRKDLNIQRKLQRQNLIHTAIPLHNIANVYWGLEQYDSSAYYFSRTLDIYRQIYAPGHSAIQSVYNGLGSVYWDKGDKTRSLEYFDRAAASDNKRNGSLLDAGGNQQELGKQELQDREYDKALAYFKQALASRMQEMGSDNPYTNSCYNYIGKTFALNNDNDQALQFYQKAITGLLPGFEDTSITANPISLDSMTSARFLLDAMVAKTTLLAEKYALSGVRADLDLAFKTAETTIKLIDHMRNSNLAEASKLFWVAKVMPFYEEAIHINYQLWALTNDKQYIDHAFRISEKAKAFLMLQSQKDLEAKSIAGIPDSLLEKEQQLKSEMVKYRKYIYRESLKCLKADHKRLALWQDRVFRLKSSYRQWIEQAEKRYPEYYRLKYSTAVIGIDALQKKLTDAHPGTLVLEYFMGARHLYVIGVSPDHQWIKALPIPDNLFQQFKHFRRSYSDPDFFLAQPDSSYRTFTRNGRLLYRKLLEPVLAQGVPAWEKIIIIPDGWLTYLPFELLLDSMVPATPRNYKKLPYLVKKRGISYAYSASLLFNPVERKVNPPKSRQLVGFAPAYPTAAPFDPSRQLSPLKYNDHELAAAENTYFGKIFTGAEATKEQFDRYAPYYSILHLAMHAIVNNEEPMYSKLVFAGAADSLSALYTYDLYQHKLAADLVILSACNTGLGKLQKGEGLISLARGFTYAGAGSVIMSLWPVDDYATPVIFKTFYQLLSTGARKPSALRRAKLHYLEQADPAAAHPFYWGGFAFIGDTSPIQSGPDTTDQQGKLFLLALILGLMVYSAKIFKKRSDLPE